MALGKLWAIHTSVSRVRVTVKRVVQGHNDYLDVFDISDEWVVRFGEEGGACVPRG